MFDRFRKELIALLLIGRVDKSIYKATYYIFLKHLIIAMVALLLVILFVKHLFESNVEFGDFALGCVVSGYLVLKNTVSQSLEKYLEEKSPN